ncbi:protein DpdJ [Pseudomonas viridiflava]|uniref:protein DpdJ n=1 Tax=Pseudomonas viridiflava TaxID=33069 RepID=UPI000F03DF9F|nr:protein DpdJ [Pseudomonas viridiflava]
MLISEKALHLLDSIEIIEMRSLEWGFTDGSLSEDEALALANVSADGGNGDELLEALIEGRLIYEFRNSSAEIRYRSRFAEMVRLLAASRQLFPNKPWQGAPHLVADFRVDRRRRRFPKRDLDPAYVLGANSMTLGKTDLRKDLWRALTNRPNMKLAAFQQRAAVRLIDGIEDSGTIVTAGTGSGKTIAFYLPALIRVGEAIAKDNWVKAISIYPRVELLKDQFAEVYRLARTMDTALAAHGRRPLLIGTLFRATPRNAKREDLIAHGWNRKGGDFVCPWLRCPTCDGELIWREIDLRAQREVLQCSQHNCACYVPDSHIVLTRSRLQKEPPDVLFTTTEILNQRLSDQWTRRLFGVDMPMGKKPLFALLDEVHTYEGATGAQAALTLRRWRHLLSGPICWAGLSATLGEAASFFADLTGANPDKVVEITPAGEEIEEQGAEYQIILRGDPASRSSLLSTTIQTSMLLPRLLDPPGLPVSKGSFGCRAFLFTDDLDVTNRLYDDLRDAEAYTIYGKPDQQRDPLADLRSAGPDAQIRDIEGQRWRVCEEIGHPLNRRLIVGRTTSQDAGVNQASNIIVATAALEVGFNDPQVGAVIQHKAPRGMASFLQRKGRAGRNREMRPVTVTVLSDYGRDRIAYQSYEHLFDPSLTAQHLPVQNPYILRIQAVYALIDWLAKRTTTNEKVWFWDLLSRPVLGASSSAGKILSAVKTQLSKIIQGDPSSLADLRAYLIASLGIDEETVESLLWEAPRSLLLEVVPTLVRRVFRQWQLAFPTNYGDRDIQVDFHPLPDFIPRSLFSDLSLPEVQIIVPPADVNHAERIETMPIVQALNQLVPGRVSRRFAFERGALAHWVPVDIAHPEQERRISDYAEEHEFVGTFRGSYNDDGNAESFLVFRPWVVRLEKVARKDALPSSNGRLTWHTDIEPNGEALTVGIPSRTQWRTYIKTACFYLHRYRASVSVRRFAPTAHANVRTLKDDFPVTIHFRSDGGLPAALGFELEVDGFYLDFDLPTASELARVELPQHLAASSTLAFLRDTFLTDADLPTDLNSFQRDWLFQVLQSALFADAADTDRTIEDSASDLLSEDRMEVALCEVMDDLFGGVPLNPDGDYTVDDVDDIYEVTSCEGGEEVGSSSPPTATRLRQTLALHLSRAIVRDRLRVLAAQFTNPDPERHSRWLRRTIVETLGEALLQACAVAAPKHAVVDTLLVDVRDDCTSNVARIWISEATLGGAGVLQAFAERFTAEPRVFFSALEAALTPTDIELVDGGLRQILDLSQSNPDIGEQLAQLRSTHSHGERSALWQSFSHALSSRGAVDLSHALAVSFNSRLLRSGAGPALDRLLVDLQKFWDDVEKRFRVTIGLREFAYVCSKKRSISLRVRSFLVQTLPLSVANKVTILDAVMSLLWPREVELRQKLLRSYNPYRQTRTTDPTLIRYLLLTRTVVTVELSDDAWRGKLNAALETDGSCRLSVVATSASIMRETLVKLVATPIDIGYLQFYPVVERFERAEGKIMVTVSLREQL